ncbi:sporulation protein YunB [Pueribacillus sp. YX66]|uniref:sporulation protein YunB n=1 Tax=Pueribacillus sp. YX66 TaxID=3229242 RepID=UPI00358D0B18
MFIRKRPRRAPMSFRTVFAISAIVFIVLTIQGLWLVESGIKPVLVEIAKAETQRIAQQAINDAVSQKMVGDVEALSEQHELVITEKDESGKITSARINSRSFNRILSEATETAQEYLNMIERGEINQWSELLEETDIEPVGDHEHGVVHYIALGKATRNALLANLGPKVPIRFHTIGEVQSKPVSDVKLVGINNIWIEINIRFEVNVNVVVPFATETDKVTANVPLVFTLINGEVPQFYNQSSEGMPPAIVPNFDQ